MKKTNKSIQFLALVAVLIGMVSSCMSLGELCSEATEQRATIRFKQKKILKTRLGRDSIVLKDTSIKMQEARVLGIVSDTNFIPKKDTITNTFAIPFNPNQNNITAIFLKKATIANPSPIFDTLSIAYTRKTQLISAQCGSKTDYTDFTVLKTSFYEIKITSVANQLNPNVEIYFLYQ
jgi:Family of unknown function (DUF6452)